MFDDELSWLTPSNYKKNKGILNKSINEKILKVIIKVIIQLKNLHKKKKRPIFRISFLF